MRENELPGVPVVNDGGRCVGIVTETDLVLPDDDGDLHLPHYVNIFGGTVFLEPLKRFEGKLRKAFASTAADMMSEDPTTVDARHHRGRGGRDHPRDRPQPAPVVEHGRLVGVVTRVDVLGGLVSVSGCPPARSRASSTGAIERNCRAPAAAGRPSCARWSRRTATATGRRAAGAALRAARLAGGGDGGRGGRAARRRHRRADPRDGRASTWHGAGRRRRRGRLGPASSCARSLPPGRACT